MLTHTLIHVWQSDNGASFAGTVTVQAGLEVNVDEAIPESASDLEVAFAADVSQLKSLFLLSDKALTLKTNSDSAPDNTIALAAGVPFVWNHQNGVALRDTEDAAISTDIAKLYATGTDAAALKIRALLDPTV